jgi:hypothetical protein
MHSIEQLGVRKLPDACHAWPLVLALSGITMMCLDRLRLSVGRPKRQALTLIGQADQRDLGKLQGASSLNTAMVHSGLRKKCETDFAPQFPIRFSSFRCPP